MNTENIHKYKYNKLLCMDIESYDPELLDKGPGTHRGKGHICGIAFATKTGSKLTTDYLSLTHPDTPEDLRIKNRQVAKDILSSNNPKLGADIAYDCEWLDHEGMPVGGKLHDVQFAEPLLNEYRRSYSLDNLAKGYHLRGKKTEVLAEYHRTMGWPGKPIEHIWRMPERVAAEYALVDVELPLEIFEKQKRNLETQNMYDLYDMETDLIPVMLKMRKNGVRLNMPLLKKTIMHVSEVHFKLQEQIQKWAKSQININSPTQLANIFDRENIPYPRHNPTSHMKLKGKTIGNPNIDKKVLQHLAKRYPVCQTILDHRHYSTLINLFLHKYSTFNEDGRLYCSFHPLRSDDYGTVSGRFSSSKPNLQQVSTKKEHFDIEGLSELNGQLVRKLFIPEEGHKWAKLDYSQVEYRIMAHYATGTGAEELRASYINDRTMDYHQRIMDLTGFERTIAKNVNFGGAYGIGQATASKLFGWSMDEADLFLNSYHKAAPYIRETRALVSNTAARRGFIFTILNRKARTHSSRKLHSMFNRLIQGSAADIMKKAMVDANNKGLFDVLKLHITVHDEVDVSYKDNPEGLEALRELQHTMEETVKLAVPLLVDCEVGNNWGELKEITL